MGTHASADVFYGVAWDSEELPELWAKEQQARWDNDDYSGDEEDEWERLEKLLKELSLDHLLDVTSHGNEYATGYSVYVKGTDIRVGCGEVQLISARVAQSLPITGICALETLLDHLGRDKAKWGWLVTVSYG